MESVVLCWLALISVAGGFYLPGLAPTKFCSSEDATKYNIDCQVLVKFYLLPTYYFA